MKNYNLLFSFSFAALSVATLGGGAIFLESNKGKISAEPAPIPALLPHPAPVDAAPPTLELPETKVAPLTISVPKVSRVATNTFKAKIAAPKEKEMVCSPVWKESNYGGQYRECEMK
jgi:hypothetical protein